MGADWIISRELPSTSTDRYSVPSEVHCWRKVSLDMVQFAGPIRARGRSASLVRWSAWHGGYLITTCRRGGLGFR